MPTVYDDTLTYYELLTKTIGYINQVIDQGNEIVEYVDEIKTEGDNHIHTISKDVADKLQRQFGLIDDNNIHQLDMIADYHRQQISDLKRIRVEMDEAKLWVENEALPDSVAEKLETWLDSGKLADIINEDVFDMKANKEDLLAINKQVTDIVVDVRVYGAKDITIKGYENYDSTEAIQEAINNHDNIRINGKFKVSEPIYIPSNKNIVGKKGTLYATDSHYFVLNINGNDVSIDGLEIVGAGNASYNSQGCLITAIGTDNGAGLSPTYLKNISITNCKLRDAGRTGVNATFVDNLIVEKCEIRNVGYSGVEGTSCRNSKVNHNEIHDISPGAPAGTGINTYFMFWSRKKNADLIRYPFSENCEANFNNASNSPWEGLDIHGCIDIRFIGNTLSGTPTGIAIIRGDDNNDVTLAGAKNVQISQNKISNCSAWGIALGNITNGKYHSNVVIDSNVITDCGGNGNGGIGIGSGKNIVVSSNTLSDCGASGIEVRSKIDGGVISGNTFCDMTSNTTGNVAAIKVSASDTRMSIIGNIMVSGGSDKKYVNRFGLMLSTTIENVNIEAYGNDFELATVGRASVTTTQAKTITPLLTMQGRAIIPVDNTTNKVTLNVSLPKKYAGNTLYEVTSSLNGTGNIKGVMCEAWRVDPSTIVITVKTSDGANFSGTADISVFWKTYGY